MGNVEAGFPAQVSAGVRWRVVILLMACVAVSHFNRISISVAGAEVLIPKNGIDPARMGTVYFTYLLLYVTCMIPGGWFIDRFGPRVALMVVGFGSAVFAALTGVVGALVASPLVLVVALVMVRACLGSVNAPIHPGAARMVALWFPPAARSLYNGLATTAAACVGIAATYPLFGMLMDWYGWPGAFFVTAVATYLVALLWTVLASDGPASETVPEPAAAADAVPAPGGFAALLRNRNLLLLTVSYGALSYFQYLFFYWIQFYFEDVLQLGKDTARWYAALLPLAMGVGMVGGGWLADFFTKRAGLRRGPVVMPMAGLCVGAVMLVLGLLVADARWAMLCFTMAMAGVGTAEAPYWTMATAVGNRRGATAAAILNTGGNAGGMIAPLVTPLLSRLVGWQGSMGVAACTCLLGAALWWWVDPTQHEQRSD